MTDNHKEDGHYSSDCREKNYSHAWMHRYECARACVWSHSWGSEGLVKRLTALVLAVARVIAGGVCFWTNEVWETRSCLQACVLSKSKNDDVEVFFYWKASECSGGEWKKEKDGETSICRLKARPAHLQSPFTTSSFLPLILTQIKCGNSVLHRSYTLSRD